MTEKQKTIITLLTNILPNEAEFATSVKGLNLFRVENSFPRSPYSYNSGIIIMGQGEKKVYLGDQIYSYDFSHYLVLPVPLPAECEGKTDPNKPILGITIDIDPIEIGEILLEMGDTRKDIQHLPKGIYSAYMTDSLYDAVIRLLKAVSDPLDIKVLAPMIKKEIIFRILQGEKGEVLQALAQHSRRFFQIAKMLRKIHLEYGSDFDIRNMAKELSMSSSTFHNCFKSVTGTSPLQYIKNVRLHKARTIMLHDGLNAAETALKVGYESPSQFNREYKRLFGETPARDYVSLRSGNN